MKTPFCGSVILSVFCLPVAAPLLAKSDDLQLATPALTVSTSENSHEAVARGLDFLLKDAAKWRTEHQCSTCHHGTMTVWALCEAKNQGYDVPDDILADMTKWTKDRLLERIDLPRDTRPGWSMVNSPALYLSAMVFSIPQQAAINPDEQSRIANHLLRHQETDGSWSWSSAPPKNRPPPFFESDEVATLLGVIALTPKSSNDPAEKPEIRDARVRAVDWLAKTPKSDTTQAASLQLLRQVCEGKAANELQVGIDALLARRNADGAWGQVAGAASDAYATGQALYVLNVAHVARDREEIQRAASILVNSQNADGSWPMTPRAHPEATPAGNTVPIIYFGSAWGTLGLARTFPK